MELGSRSCCLSDRSTTDRGAYYFFQGEKSPRGVRIKLDDFTAGVEVLFELLLFFFFFRGEGEKKSCSRRSLRMFVLWWNILILTYCDARRKWVNKVSEKRKLGYG